MKIKIGTYRMVILSSSFVIKLPRLRRTNYLALFLKGESKTAKHNIEFSIRMFIAGIRENWDEFKCWEELKANFLIPTYFSLFGLVNIQQRSVGESITNEELTQILKKIIARKVPEREFRNHTIVNRENYHRYEGQGLKLLDYGGIRKFVIKWQKVFEEVLLST